MDLMIDHKGVLFHKKEYCEIYYNIKDSLAVNIYF